MTTQIEIVPYDGMNKGFLSQIQTWVNNVLKKANPSSTPPYLRLTIWKNLKDVQDFYYQEKEELGIVTGEESDFLATHEDMPSFMEASNFIHLNLQIDCRKRQGLLVLIYIFSSSACIFSQ